MHWQYKLVLHWHPIRIHHLAVIFKLWLQSVLTCQYHHDWM